MKTIYDNVHRRYTTWSPPLVQLINTPEFQRLKRIKQLSACHHVFPGATHTRFEHSLGVGFLAASFVRALARNQPELVVRLDEGGGDNTKSDIDAVVLAFQLAGLCHDLGHATLSHGFDTLVATFDPPAPAHEARSVALLRHLVRAYNLPLPPAVVGFGGAGFGVDFGFDFGFEAPPARRFRRASTAARTPAKAGSPRRAFTARFASSGSRSTASAGIPMDRSAASSCESSRLSSSSLSAAFISLEASSTNPSLTQASRISPNATPSRTPRNFSPAVGSA